MVPATSRLEPQSRNLHRVFSLPVSGGKMDWVRAMTRTIRSRRVQIVHVHHGRDYWPAIVAARTSGCAVRVVTSRHLMTIPSWATRNFLLRMTDVVAVSKAVWGVIDENFTGPRSRLHRIYPGIDTASFRPCRDAEVMRLRQQLGWCEDAIGFGLAGNFSPPEGKGHLDFLRAAAQIHRELPQARFVLIGPEAGQPLLLEAIRALNLEGVASILPFSQQMPVVMNALDVLVHPAVGTEALGLVILEALACAKPVIASRLDGIPETFIDQEHGLLVPPRDVERLAGAMRKLACDSSLRHRFGEAGREFIGHQFDRRQYANRSRELYAHILDRHRHER